MDFLEYRAIDKNKNGIKEIFCCTSIIDFEKFITQNGFFLIKVKKKFFLKNYINKRDTIEFFTYLRTALQNKLDLISSLNLCLSGTRNKFFRAVIQNMILSIKSGINLSNSMMVHQYIFSALEIKMIEVAEKTANMIEVLSYVIEYLSTRMEIKSSIKSLTIYPFILLSMIFLIIFFWCFYIVPSFVECFNDMGIPQNSVTSAIMIFRDFSVTHDFEILIVFSLFMAYLFISKYYPSIKLYKTSILSKIPFIKDIKRDFMILDFFTCMNVLLHGGIQITESIDISSNLIQDSKMRSQIKQISRNIYSGMRFSNAISGANLFLGKELSMMKIAEETNTIPFSFKTLSEMTKIGIDKKLKCIISIAQPLTIIFAGILLLAVLYSVISPIYDNLNTSF